MTRRRLGVLLVVSIAVNLVLGGLFLRERRRALNAGPESCRFAEGDGTTGAFLVSFRSAMSTAPGPLPVVLKPDANVTYSWDDPRTLRVLPDEPPVPGLAYEIRAAEGARDAAGRPLSRTPIAVTAGRLRLLDLYALTDGPRDDVRLVFRFNGAVSPTRLLTRVRVVDREGREIELHPEETQSLASVSLRAAALPDSGPLEVRIRAGLAADGATEGLEDDVKQSVGLAPDRLIRSVSAESDREGIRLVFQATGDLDRNSLSGCVTVVPEVAFTVVPDYWGNRYILKGDFRPRTFYRVTFSGELRATGGTTQGKPVSFTTVTGNLRPLLEFATTGPNLPVTASRSLPVRFRNVEKATFSVYRIYPNNLVHALRYGYGANTGEGHLVGTADFDPGLPEDETGILNVPLTDLIGPYGSGVFAVQANGNRGWGTHDSRTVVLTDMAGTFAVGRDRAAVAVLEIPSGKPLPDCTVELLSCKDQLVGKGVTGPDGTVLIPLLADAAGEMRPHLAVLRRGESVAVVEVNGDDSRNVAAFELEGRPFPRHPYEALVVTERGIYRPGETVRAAVIVRDESLNAAAGVPVQLVLADPRGRTLMKHLASLSPDGFAEADFPIPADALSGGYTLRCEEPGNDAAVWGEAEFSVGAFTPDRIRCDLTTDAEVAEPGDVVRLGLRSRYYFGTPAADMAVKFRTRYEPAPFRADAHPGFTFEDPDRSWTPSVYGGTYPGMTDEEGRADQSVAIPIDATPPAAMSLLGIAAVSLPGGRTVSATTRVTVFPYPFYLGIRAADEGADPDASGSASFRWICLSRAGEPRAPGVSLRYELVREVWVYSLVSEEGGRLVRKWVRNEVPESEGEIPAATSAGSFAVPVSGSGSYILRLRAGEGDHRTVLRFARRTGAGRTARTPDPSLLTVETDAETYAPGQTARLRFVSPFAGTGIVTASGHSPASATTFPVAVGENEVLLGVPETPFGTCHAAVTIVNESLPATEGGDALPLRMFGIAVMPIDRQARRLAVDVSVPDRAVPGKETAMTVTLRRNGEPARGTVRLMLVDEGILALTGYRLPDPFAFFYGERQCGVGFADPYDRLFPDIAARFGTVSRIGGDAVGRFLPPVDPAERPEAAVVVRTVPVDATGTARVVVPIPEFSGAFRVMAFAVNEQAVGHREVELPVRRDLTVEVNGPAAAAPGDEFEVTAILFNHDAPGGEFEVRTALSGPVALAAGEVPPRIALKPGEERRLTVRLTANPDALGPARFELTLLQGEMEAKGALAWVVRPGALPVFRSQYRVLKPGEEVRFDAADAGFLTGTAEAMLQVSGRSDIEAAPALAVLLPYPYGCLEQTVSRALPQLALRDLAAAMGPTFAPQDGAEDGLLRDAIVRLAVLETPAGGFAMWPGGRDPWVPASIHACRFLLECSNRGVAVDPAMTARCIAFLRDVAQGRFGARTGLEDRADALYLLAVGGRPENGIATGLAVDPEAPGFARLLAAAAAIRGGMAREGAEALNRLAATDAVEGSAGGELDSRVRRTGIALAALCDTVLDHPLRLLLSERLRAARNEQGHWGNTQDNALAVLALGRLAEVEAAGPAGTGTVTVEGRDPVPVAGERFVSAAGDTAVPVTVRATGDGPLYVSRQLRGVPKTMPAEDVSQGLTVRRMYVAEDGSPVTEVNHGDTVRVRIELRATERLRHVILADLLPGGFDIERQSLETRWSDPDRFEGLTVTFAEKLDDRMLLGCHVAPLGENRPAVFEYTLRAVARGRYAVPRVSAEAMYRPEIRGESGGSGSLVIR